MLLGMLVGWCCSWARLAEAIIGLVSLGYFTPHFALRVTMGFNSWITNMEKGRT